MDAIDLIRMKKIEIAIINELKKQTRVRCSGCDLNVEIKGVECSNGLDNYRPEGIDMESLEHCVGATLYGIFRLNVIKENGFVPDLYDLIIKAKLEYDGEDYKAEIIEPITAVKHY